MVTHMKTTVELSPDLMDRAKKRAKAEALTFKAFLESAILQALKTPAKKARRKMKDLSFKGDGYQAGVDPKNWEQIRSLMYEGHGG